MLICQTKLFKKIGIIIKLLEEKKEVVCSYRVQISVEVASLAVTVLSDDDATAWAAAGGVCIVLKML